MRHSNPLIIRIWTCEQCGKIELDHEESSSWSDPVNVPPKGWDHLADGNTFVCGDCIKKEREAVPIAGSVGMEGVG